MPLCLRPILTVLRRSRGPVFNDVFGGPPKYTNSNTNNKASTMMNDFDYDSIFKSSNDSKNNFCCCWSSPLGTAKVFPPSNYYNEEQREFYQVEQPPERASRQSCSVVVLTGDRPVLCRLLLQFVAQFCSFTVDVAEHSSPSILMPLEIDATVARPETMYVDICGRQSLLVLSRTHFPFVEVIEALRRLTSKLGRHRERGKAALNKH
nr:auxilin-related protein 2-like [Ipomoea batatas]